MEKAKNNIEDQKQAEVKQEIKQAMDLVFSQFQAFVLSMVSRHSLSFTMRTGMLDTLILMYAQYKVTLWQKIVSKIDAGSPAEKSCLEELSSLAHFFASNQEAAPYEGSDLSVNLKIADYRAHVFAAKTACQETEKSCDMALATIKSSTLFYIFTDGAIDTMEELHSYLQEKERYLDALLDFQNDEKTLDDLPDSFFDLIDEIYCLKSQLTLLVSLQHTSSRSKCIGPHSFDDISEHLNSLYQTARLANCADFADNFLDEHLVNAGEIDKLRASAIYEMREILENDDNFTGYHIGHITTGKMQYQATAAKISNTADGEDAQTFEILYGSVYDKKEDARKELDTKFNSTEYINQCVIEFPSDEWFSVVKNVDGKKAYPFLFDTQLNAVAALYYLARPKNYIEYLIANTEQEKNNDADGE